MLRSKARSSRSIIVTDNRPESFGRLRRRVVAAVFFLGLAFGGYQALYHPKTPLSPGWNPTQPFGIDDPVTPLTGWKIGRLAEMPELCLATLNEAGSRFDRQDDLVESATCHIRPRVLLRATGAAKMTAVETRCATALRLAMWERHGLQPAARSLMATKVTGIEHLSSYSCRNIRLPGGDGGRPSTHATADAIDITGFTFADGRRLRLLEDWGREGPEGAFLRAARDSACIWFKTALGPDYNALHRDHFHLQSRGFGTCR